MMKWTVLSDNRSCDDRLQTEHGLSILLETDRHRLLLDTGASDVFLRNAERLGIDLSTVDYLFLSHGHSDHVGGLGTFIGLNPTARILVSPDAIGTQFYSRRKALHSITSPWPVGIQPRLWPVDHTQVVADGIRVIARIPQRQPMPQGNSHLCVLGADGSLLPDDFRHEIALYADGLLFTGCAHSGLENILAACPWPVKCVVGGFHLLDAHESDTELTALATRLIEGYPHTQFYTSHCTGDAVFATLKSVMGDRLHAFSCGMRVEEPTLAQI